MLMIEWRAWLTDRYLGEWMTRQAYYRLQLLDKGTDNPDQRIADDLNIFVDLTLTLSLGLLSAVVTLVSFVRILWTISVYFGAVLSLDFAWLVADTLNALMAIPNLIALLALSPVVVQLTRAGLDRALRAD